MNNNGTHNCLMATTVRKDIEAQGKVTNLDTVDQGKETDLDSHLDTVVQEGLQDNSKVIKHQHLLRRT